MQANAAGALMNATVTTEGEPPGRGPGWRAGPGLHPLLPGTSLSSSRFPGLGIPASDPGLCEPKFWDCLACHTREPVLRRSRRRMEPSATGLSVVGRAAAGGNKEELSLPLTPTPTLKSVPWAFGGARTSSPPGGRVPAAPSAACTSQVPRVSLLSPPAAWASDPQSVADPPALGVPQMPICPEERPAAHPPPLPAVGPGHPGWAPGGLGALRGPQQRGSLGM